MLNQNTFTVIRFVLDNLHRQASVGFDSYLQFQGLILDLDGFIALARARTTKKRQTAFLGVIRTFLLDDLGIEHHGICRSSSTFVKKRDNALIIFAAIPTQLSLCAINVSSKSCATCRSSFVATSNFPARKMVSCISSLTITINPQHILVLLLKV